MKSFRLGLISVCAVLAFPPVAQAQNLLQFYDMARHYDASYQAAKSLYEASVSKAAQGQAQLLPTVNMGLTTTRAQLDYRPDTPTTNDVAFKRWYLTNSATITAVQPLYRPANMALYLQSSKVLGQAVAQLATAEQDLMVRVSQAYFDVLGSQDSLAFVKAQKVAVAEQLASAKRNFEVGTATITDTREAQARYDLVLAQEIGAENDLRVKRLAIDNLVGVKNANPRPLVKSATFKPNLPEDPESWVKESASNHPSVLNARLALDIARLEIDRAKAGHKPTVDLQGSYGGTRNLGGTAASGINSFNSHVVAPSLQVLVNIPLFAGFATENRYLETVSLEDKARHDLEAVERTVAQATRAAYYGVVSGMGQVKALEAAESSSQVALDANKLGYSVGVRINIDGLNSQSQLFQTKRDLAKARYDVLVGNLKLRQASGMLKENDLQGLNALFEP